MHGQSGCRYIAAAPWAKVASDFGGEQTVLIEEQPVLWQHVMVLFPALGDMSFPFSVCRLPFSVFSLYQEMRITLFNRRRHGVGLTIASGHREESPSND